MKQLLQSTFFFVAVFVLVLMNIVNTCQLNNLEEQVIATGKAVGQLAEEGVSVRGGGGGAGAMGAGANANWDAQDKEALADPANILVAHEPQLPDPQKTVYGGTLRLQIGQDPKGLNPYIASGADVTEYNRYATNVLAYQHREDPALYSPELAVKVTTPDDGLTYVIELRKGVLWHQPTVDWESGRYDWLKGDHELTTDDYRFVFDLIANDQVAGRISAMRNFLESFESFEAIDQHTFKVKFSERLYTNLGIVLGLEPMPRWLYMYDEDGNKYDDATWGMKFNEHWYNRKAIGTGPFRFVEWEPGVKMVFERNKNYWGPRPAFDRMLMKVIKDQEGWVRELKTGQIDFTQLQPEQYKTYVLDASGPLLGKEGIKMNRQPTLGYFYVGWNMDTPHFKDKRVRQAMTMAFNREALLKNVFHGLGKLTSGPFAQQDKCYDQSIEPWPFDLAAAKAKLEEAGWKDTDGDGIRDKVINGEKTPFEFVMLLFGGSNEYNTLANVYREDLLSIGVKLVPVSLEWSTMLKKMDEKEFGAYTGAWVLSHPVDLMQLWHSKEADRPKSSNRVGFRNKEADRIAEGLRREFDEDKRVELCHQFHALVHEEQPYTFFYQRERPVLFWDYMNDLQYSIVWPWRDMRFQSFKEKRD